MAPHRSALAASVQRAVQSSVPGPASEGHDDAIAAVPKTEQGCAAGSAQKPSRCLSPLALRIRSRRSPSAVRTFGLPRIALTSYPRDLTHFNRRMPVFTRRHKGAVLLVCYRHNVGNAAKLRELQLTGGGVT
jgi:hypothetical protein